MTDIPSFPYEDLWHERTIRSVANLTREDGHEFLGSAPEVPIRTTVTTYPLGQGRAGAGRPARGAPSRAPRSSLPEAAR